ncbi:MAG: four helix bundle protein [bacterium]|nr:four helix bundle protein [bacterium]
MESQKSQEKIQSFTDLVAWRKAHELVVIVYRLTKSFPKEELFGLSNQLRRAAVSVSSNIAEGFSRRSRIEKNRFYDMAQGSLTEVQNQLLVARDVGYISKFDFSSIAQQTVIVHKLITGLVKSSRDNS